MPSSSKKQHKLMAAVAHNPEFAKKVKIPQSVGKDFVEADKGKTFRKGGTTNPKMSSINKQQTHHGKIQMPNVNLNKYMGARSIKFKEGGATMKHEDIKMDKKVAKKAIGMHEDQMHGGKKSDMSKLKNGGVAKKVTKEMEYDYKTGKKSFAGSTAARDRHAEKEGKMVAKHLAYDEAKGMKKGGKCYANGGYVKAADGCAVRGKTRGTMV